MMINTQSYINNKFDNKFYFKKGFKYNKWSAVHSCNKLFIRWILSDSIFIS